MARKNHRAPPRKRDTPSFDRSDLVFERPCSTLLPTTFDFSQGTTKIEGLRQAHTLKRGATNLKHHCLTDLLSILQPVAHTPSFSHFLSPHPSPFRHSSSTVRERLSLAVTVDIPGSRPSHFSARESSQHCEHSEHGEPSDSELSQHTSLISWHRRSMAMRQLKATRPSSQSSRKSATTSPDQSCPKISKAQHSLLCSYTYKPTVLSLPEQDTSSFFQRWYLGPLSPGIPPRSSEKALQDEEDPDTPPAPWEQRA